MTMFNLHTTNRTNRCKITYSNNCFTILKLKIRIKLRINLLFIIYVSQYSETINSDTCNQYFSYFVKMTYML